MKNKFARLTVFMSVMSGLAHAQTVPDAGALRQQIEQDQTTRLPRRAAPEKPAEPATMKSLSTTTITVRSFQFAGNTLLSNEQLNAVVSDYLNRPLTFNQLQAAATAVANAYREAGWVVRTYLPKQDITDGNVTIQIVEAVFGKIQLEGPQPTRLKLDYVLSSFDKRQKKGKHLNADELDRALLLVDDLPGIAAAGSLRKGEEDGETDLVLKLTDEPLLIGDAGVDNTGLRSTGSERVTANVALNSPLGMGDLLTASAIHSRGMDYLRVGFSAPIGVDGWRVGANASNLNYALISPEFTALNARGNSNTVGLEATYPLLRSRQKNVYLVLNYDQKSFDNESSGSTSSRYKSSAVSIGLSGNLFDNFGGGGANSAGVSFVNGVLNLDGSPNKAADTTTTQTAGSYSKVRYNLSRQQVITPTLSFLALYSGQEASKNLDSSEKFYLGGANGVRAYPSNEGGGSEGKLLNLELRWKFTEGFLLSGFYDWGNVTVNRNNNFTGNAVPNNFTLRGAGVSLGWQSSQGLNIKTVWARRIGDNPNPSSTGTDQDGTLIKNRFWLTASMPL